MFFILTLSLITLILDRELRQAVILDLSFRLVVKHLSLVSLQALSNAQEVPVQPRLQIVRLCCNPHRCPLAARRYSSYPCR